jgi:uncharacterized protein (DUF433 family)
VKAKDLRDIPNYSIPEVSIYLKLPVATLRSWVLGRNYPTEQGMEKSEPLIQIADPQKYLLSFINLVEAHVLSAIRRIHEIPMTKIRPALHFIERHYKTKHPLAEKVFETDGVNLFIRECNELLNISRKGQLGIKTILEVYLKRIERDDKGRPLRIYPLRYEKNDEPKCFMIDPCISFGRLVIAGTGIPIDVLAERYNAGESIESIAKDYGSEEEKIKEAILWQSVA